MGTIDRVKHDIDVVERVLGHADDHVSERGGRTHVVELDLRSGIVGSITSGSDITIGGLAPPDHEPPER